MGKPERDVDELREEIEGIILRGAKDFFDAAEDRSALEVTIRICCEFYEFLMGADDPPDSSDANYMASQIRSGIEEYFTLEQYGRVLSGLKLQEGFSGKLPQTFAELKTEYEAIFQQILDCDASEKGAREELFIFSETRYRFARSFVGQLCCSSSHVYTSTETG